MSAFEYQAVDANGKTKSGLIEADTARQARQQLRGMNLMPVSIGEVSANASKTSTGSSRERINVPTVALITRQLATLISAGQPLESAYLTVSKQTPKAQVKRILLAVRTRILEGHPLSEALAGFPRIFDTMYCASVNAGEQSGLLDLVMERLADYLEAKQELQQKTTLALIYPVLLSIVALGLVSVLLVFVVPQIVQVFEGFDQELPQITQLLISISDFARDNGFTILIIIIGIIFSYGQLMKIDHFRLIRDKLVLMIPFVNYLVRLSNTSRYTRTLSILVTSGVTALESMRISSAVLVNQPMKSAVLKAADKVREGELISTTLEQTGYFSPMILQLIANGEASGKLGEMLRRSAQAEESEFARITAIFVGLFEPAMILFMGMVVLAIVLAILLPIFDMNDLIQ
jgi:general secretion pathway protein F